MLTYADKKMAIRRMRVMLLEQEINDCESRGDIEGTYQASRKMAELAFSDEQNETQAA